MHKLLFLFGFLCFQAVLAQVPSKPSGASADPLQEVRVQKLAGELRCLVCQNQSLADSNADLAVDLKNQVREKVKQGASDEQVIQFMTERYGDFVLYRPPLKMTTALLWFGPALLLIGGLIALFVRLRRRGQAQPESALSAEEHARATALLEGGADKR
jgi:cytochrome c-type biogenesis protein CcmH